MNNIINKVFILFKKNILNIIILILIILLYILIFIVLIYKKDNNKNDNMEDNLIVENIETNQEEIKKEEFIYVDVKGSIKKPNVYKLIKGSRTIDAIKEAGGLLKNANTRFINLSKELNDGDVIVIYSNDEIKKAQKTQTIYVETPCVCEEIKNDSCYNESDDNTNNKININNASLEELMTLSGIGESKAKAIIEYRKTNGNFNSIEEIIKVSGISETIFNKIKENITI